MPVIGPFPYPPHELMLMGAAAIWLRPRLIIEWGTNVGASARVWWEVAKRYGLDTEIHSIDLPTGADHFEHPGRNRGVLVRGLGVTLHQGDGVEVACDLISKRHVVAPLIFIEGDHSASAVLREGSEIWHLCPAASILFHDTFESRGSQSGPREALGQLLAMRQDKPRLYEMQIGPAGMILVVPGNEGPDALTCPASDRRERDAPAIRGDRMFTRHEGD
jgi:hypothetical protein